MSSEPVDLRLEESQPNRGSQRLPASSSRTKFSRGANLLVPPIVPVPPAAVVDRGANSPLPPKGRVPAVHKKGRRASVCVSPFVEVPATDVSDHRARSVVSPIGVLPVVAVVGECGATAAVSPIPSVPLTPIVAELARAHRSRQAFVSAKVKIQLQIKAMQRSAHAQAGCPKATHATCPGVYKTQTVDTEALADVALKPLEKYADVQLKMMLKVAEQLPASALEFCDSIRGFGRASLAQIVAEAGDLSNYPNPAKLWSRMGLGLSKSGDTFYEGRSPTRRAIMAVIGANFLKSGGAYRLLYDERKAYEQTKPPCGKKLKVKDDEGVMCMSADGTTCRPGHIHNRTLRWLEKRLLRDLWRAWRSEPPLS